MKNTINTVFEARLTLEMNGKKLNEQEFNRIRNEVWKLVERSIIAVKNDDFDQAVWDLNRANDIVLEALNETE